MEDSMEVSLLENGQGQDHPVVGLDFAQVKYTVHRGTSKEKEILHGVSGYIPGGKVTALFGPTGSGKTTLLDVIAGRKEKRRTEGSILVNGVKLEDQSLGSMAGYVVQDDCLMGNLTCKENIMFSAQLRLSTETSDTELQRIVTQVIGNLGLNGCADTLVGDDFVRGLSGGERKRTSIGCELVIQPRILLLDEPSSGLDARTAHDVVEQLVALSRAGTTVLMSIHQPRYSIFKLLDHVILLSRGHIVYAGAQDQVVPYFNSVGFTCESFNNPADFLLDVLSGIVPRKSSDVSTHQQQQESFRHVGTMADIAHNVLQHAWEQEEEGKQSLTLQESASASGIGFLNRGPRRPSFQRQFWLISQKTLKGISRLPQVIVMQLCTMVFFGVITGAIYYKMDFSQNGLQNRLGAFFFLIMSMVFGNLNGIEIFLKERALFIHQRSNNYYETGPYFLAMMVCDLIPMRIFPMLVYCGIVYPMVGFQAKWSNFAWFVATLVVEAICSGTLCYWMSASIGIFAIANLAVSVVYVVSMIFGGLLVSLDSLPHVLRWIQYLSFFKHGYESLAVTELHGLEFDFIGSIKVSGDQILEQRGFKLHNQPTDILAMLLLSLVFSFLSYRALAKLTHRG